MNVMSKITELLIGSSAHYWCAFFLAQPKRPESVKRMREKKLAAK